MTIAWLVAKTPTVSSGLIIDDLVTTMRKIHLLRRHYFGVE